jgi:hypothetical protein
MLSRENKREGAAVLTQFDCCDVKEFGCLHNTLRTEG